MFLNPSERQAAAQRCGFHRNVGARALLRSGFSTQAARDDYLPAQIADVTRHQDRRTLDSYIQAG